MKIDYCHKFAKPCTHLGAAVRASCLTCRQKRGSFMKRIVKMGISLVCGGILMTAQAEKEVERPLAVNGETLQRYYQNIFRENMLRYREAVKSASSREDALKELFEISAMLRNIERAGDHIKNICEHVLYMMKGQHYDFG